MILHPPAKPVRPYWHVDLKWICGILLFFVLGAALLLYNLNSLTERDRAVTLSATIVASLFSKDGLDDEKSVAEFRQKAAATPGEMVAPIEQFPWLTVSKQEVATLSPRELRLAIFSKITGPIYDKGLKGAAAQFTNDPAEQEKFAKDAALLGVLTKTTHQAVQRAFIVTAILALLLMAAVIYFSAGWGRAVSPAALLLAVSPLGALAGLLLLHPPSDGNAPLAALPSSIAQEIGGSLSRSYLVAAILGVILLLTALASKLTPKFLRRRGQKPSKSK
ncbi:MAG TPA: hypothetical protein VJ836_01340 [Candidatus Saccharimonadales bacterium]|nr:hypothetical protein [Candidatus Saccharimonadales bacterium]